MKLMLVIFTFFFYCNVCNAQNLVEGILIADGQMPSVVKDKNNRLHIAIGKGDSILYTSSTDGRTFTPASLVAIVPKLFSFAMRGPQIASTTRGLIITAVTQNGDIVSLQKEGKGKWSRPTLINEKETAKEGLIALSSDGLHAFVVWLGVRNPTGQQLMGASSYDGGRTWSKGTLVYNSPDSTVCECCKPSVEMKGNKVVVLFRNWLNGNRDMYIISSGNAGRSFGPAEKIGTGSWKLNGCPMDGGGLVLDRNSTPQVIFRRETKLYVASPRLPEKLLAEGRNGTIEMVHDKNIYAWTANGNVVVVKPTGEKLNLGKGSGPILKKYTNDQVVCVWEKDKKIYAALIPL